ncbi:LuxR family transcriptional regulator [Mycobacterium cookii]|uniref:LuxR family transcriptional regulator n=1 Tax=Mycobacterium cookii TaxID=1775 RepID=UPI001E3B6B19|nr:LuxR family transcriptional regulator [Mycobacterium cookii]
MNELLPTGTVTLLLADVEGSTRLWEAEPDEMGTALARLNQTVSCIIANHEGVRPVEQGEGDSFVAAFARASDAVAAALEIQRAPLVPLRLRIGIHTGEIQLRDEGNYAGPTINRTARLRDLGHGGQTLLSGTTEGLIADRLPADTWLTDLGTHELRGVPHPERVVQLCHRHLINEFPPLRTSKNVASQHLPAHITSFVGREGELIEVRELLRGNRLVTLTGAGGAGKTRLALKLAEESNDCAWYVDLAPITDGDLVPITAARAFGLPDQPGRSTIDTLAGFIADRPLLVVLDNCEHLLDATAALAVALLRACAGLTLLATSREPIGVAGEASWRLPSLSLPDEAIELFIDRARQARADFAVTDENSAVIGEICTRLDGLPLAIELAAARVRALSVTEILDSLHDRFRLLTGGARTAVRRQQTLRASVDWSHALLSESEQMVFRQVAAFLGGFDLDAAQAVLGGDMPRYQVIDLLTLLVDKSLVVADERRGRTRYRLLETVRHYAAEKLSESGEADEVRTRHRDHYTSMAALLDGPAGNDYGQRVEQTEAEIDNMRAAFEWSRDSGDAELALALASSLSPLWQPRPAEGVAWLDSILDEVRVEDRYIAPRVRARALADRVLLVSNIAWDARLPGQAEEALAIARECDDDALLARALAACGLIGFDSEAGRSYRAEATELARKLGDRLRLSHILSVEILAAMVAGDLTSKRAAAQEGCQLADAIGYRAGYLRCSWYLGLALLGQGDTTRAIAHFGRARDVAAAGHFLAFQKYNSAGQSMALAYQGDISAARAAASQALDGANELGSLNASLANTALGMVALAAGDPAGARTATDAACRHGPSIPPGMTGLVRAWNAQAALADGDLPEARRRAEGAVSTAVGWYSVWALTARARVALAQGDMDEAERDAHDALTCASEFCAYLVVPDLLECVAVLLGDGGSHREAARLLGAAGAVRDRTRAVRFKVWDAGYKDSVADLRNTMGDSDFESAWAEGAALSTEEAIAYAQRGRGKRKRPSSGWTSLTPAERDVVRLVSEGLANNDIASRLFISPRTVQTHLTHVYTKLGLTSRVQLAQEAGRH